MPWFHYHQNNSGGFFERGMPHNLFVEAESAHVANARAAEVGVYFDGCDWGIDCDCCGDRWSRARGPDDLPTDRDDYYAQEAKLLRAGSSQLEDLFPTSPPESAD